MTLKVNCKYKVPGKLRVETSSTCCILKPVISADDNILTTNFENLDKTVKSEKSKYLFSGKYIIAYHCWKA